MRIWFTAVILLALHPADTAAQAVRGRILDADSDIPISFAQVSLVNEEGKPVRSGLADDAGRFLLMSPTSGLFHLYAEGFGFLTGYEGPIELTPDDTLDVEIRLLASPLSMDPLEIRAEPKPRSLELVGYFDRKELGLGHFIDQDEIDQRSPRLLSDLFRTVPAFRLIPTGDPGGSVVLASRRMMTVASGLCLPGIYLDGIPQDPGRIDQVIDPFDVEAVEIYAGGAQVPAQYSGADSGCGVVLVWSRK